MIMQSKQQLTISPSTRSITSNGSGGSGDSHGSKSSTLSQRFRHDMSDRFSRFSHDLRAATDPKFLHDEILEKFREEPYNSLLREIRDNTASSVEEIKKEVFESCPTLKAEYESGTKEFPLLKTHFLDGYISVNKAGKSKIDITWLKAVLDTVIKGKTTLEEATNYLQDKWKESLVEKYSALEKKEAAVEHNKDVKVVYFVGSKNELPNEEKVNELRADGYQVVTIKNDKEYTGFASAKRDIKKSVVAKIEENEKKHGWKVENSIIIGVGAGGSYVAKVADHLLEKDGKKLLGVELINPEKSRRKMAKDFIFQHPIATAAVVLFPIPVLPALGLIMAVANRDPAQLLTPFVMVPVELKRLALNNRNMTKIPATSTPTSISSNGIFLSSSATAKIASGINRVSIRGEKGQAAEEFSNLGSLFKAFKAAKRVSPDGSRGDSSHSSGLETSPTARLRTDTSFSVDMEYITRPSPAPEALGGSRRFEAKPPSTPCPAHLKKEAASSFSGEVPEYAPPTPTKEQRALWKQKIEAGTAEIDYERVNPKTGMTSQHSFTLEKSSTTEDVPPTPTKEQQEQWQKARENGAVIEYVDTETGEQRSFTHKPSEQLDGSQVSKALVPAQGINAFI